MIAKIIISLFLTCAGTNLQAQVNFITTIAGNDTAGYYGDNGPASSSKLNQPETLCLDGNGNILIADAANHRIRKIDIATNIISTVAGNGIGGYNGDNIPATNAALFIPDAVATDTLGNIYIADAINRRIRKIDKTSGLITTICGTGSAGNTGDGGPAVNATVSLPTGLGLDQLGNIYLADILNNNLRKIDATTGKISTIAGIGIAGYSGDGGTATNAKLSGPAKVYIDDSGNILFTEVYNHVVRKVSALTGIISTIAGNGTAGYIGDNGLAVTAKLNQPYGIFADKQYNVFIADWGNGAIRKINGSNGIITSVAGMGVQGFSGDDGPATNAKLYPDGVWIDKHGTMYIADMNNNRIRKVYNPQLNVNVPSLDNHVSVYPNPTNGELTIEYDFTTHKDGVLQITDIAGRIVATQILLSNKRKEDIDIHALSQGLYLYRVLQENTFIATGKIIKQ